MTSDETRFLTALGNYVMAEAGNTSRDPQAIYHLLHGAGATDRYLVGERAGLTRAQTDAVISHLGELAYIVLRQPDAAIQEVVLSHPGAQWYMQHVLGITMSSS